jgi:hypothetical protein
VRNSIALLLLVSSTAFADPKLQEPWSRGDFRGTPEQFQKLVGVTNGSCNEGICLAASVDGRGLEVTLKFEKLDAARAFTKPWGAPFFRDHWRLEVGKDRLVLAQLKQGDDHKAEITLEDFVPLKQLVTAKAPTGLANVVGMTVKDFKSKLGKHATCDASLTSCTLWVPANEAGITNGWIELDEKNRIGGVSLSMTCETDCEIGRALREFTRVLGKPKFRTDDALQTKVAAFGKKLTITWSLQDRKQAVVCIGRCLS